MFNNAYLIISNNVVVGARAVDMGITQARFESMTPEEQNDAVKEAAWEYAEAYPTDEECGKVTIVVSLGYVGCDTHVDTDLETLEEWEELDINEQNSIINGAFWEAVDCYVVFEPNEAEAEKHTAWGGK